MSPVRRRAGSTADSRDLVLPEHIDGLCRWCLLASFYFLLILKVVLVDVHSVVLTGVVFQRLDHIKGETVHDYREPQLRWIVPSGSVFRSVSLTENQKTDMDAETVKLTLYRCRTLLM